MSSQRVVIFLRALALLAAGPAAVATYPALGWWAVLLAVAGGPLGLLFGLVSLRAVLPAPVVQAGVGERVVAVVGELSAAAGVDAPRVVVSSRATHASVSWCGATPQLVFPAVWAQELSDEELHAYVRHELAHVVQPELRGGSRLFAISSLLVPVAFGAGLGSLLATGGPTHHPAGCVVLSLVPPALTLLLLGRRLPRRALSMRLELAADRQAVEWGAAPSLLADTLVRMQEKPLRVSQPLYQRALYTLLLTYLPDSFSERRIAVLRALAAER